MNSDEEGSENELLNDYRCMCGKLLFRGLILSGAIEVKCRNCKHITSVDGIVGSFLNDDRYILLTARDGRIEKTSITAATKLGYTTAQLTALHLHDVLMVDADKFYASLLSILSATHATTQFHAMDRSKSNVLTPVRVTAVQYLQKGEPIVIFEVTRSTVKNRSLSAEEIMKVWINNGIKN